VSQLPGGRGGLVRTWESEERERRTEVPAGADVKYLIVVSARSFIMGVGYAKKSDMRFARSSRTRTSAAFFSIFMRLRARR
jgi:hypothetical protein